MKTWIIGLGIGLAVTVLLVGGMALGGGYMGRAGYWHGPGAMMMSGAFGTMPWFGVGLLLMLFMGAVIGGLALLMVGLRGRNDRSIEDRDTPLDTLKRRYARGEIDHEEFEQIKDALSELD
jgi:putative membrane protein